MEEKVLDESPSEHASLLGLDDVSDEFYDVLEPSDIDLGDDGWASYGEGETYLQFAGYTAQAVNGCRICEKTA